MADAVATSTFFPAVTLADWQNIDFSPSQGSRSVILVSDRVGTMAQYYHAYDGTGNVITDQYANYFGVPQSEINRMDPYDEIIARLPGRETPSSFWRVRHFLDARYIPKNAPIGIYTFEMRKQGVAPVKAGDYDYWVRIGSYEKALYTRGGTRFTTTVGQYQAMIANLPLIFQWSAAAMSESDPRRYLDYLKIAYAGMFRFNKKLTPSQLSQYTNLLENKLYTSFLEEAFFALETARSIQDLPTLQAVLTELVSNRASLAELTNHMRAPFYCTFFKEDGTTFTVPCTIPDYGQTAIRAILYKTSVSLNSALYSLAARVTVMESKDMVYTPTAEEQDPLHNPYYILDVAATKATGETVFQNISLSPNKTFESISKYATTPALSPEAFALAPATRASYYLDPNVVIGEGAPAPAGEKGPNWLLWAAGGIAAALAVKQAL